MRAVAVTNSEQAHCLLQATIAVTLTLDLLLPYSLDSKLKLEKLH